MRHSDASRMDGVQSVLSWDKGVDGRRWGPENAWNTNAALPSGWRPQKRQPCGYDHRHYLPT